MMINVDMMIYADTCRRMFRYFFMFNDIFLFFILYNGYFLYFFEAIVNHSWINHCITVGCMWVFGDKKLETPATVGKQPRYFSRIANQMPK